MRHTVWSWRVLAACLFAVCGSAAARSPEPYGKPYRFHTVVPAYWRFVERDSHPERGFDVNLFRAEVIEPEKEVFSSVAGRQLGDAGLSGMMRVLARQTDELRRVEAEFPGRLDKAWRRFAEKVPDLKAGASVYLLPAPRFAVGGSVRPLGERNAVIFGTEEIGTTLGSKTGFDVLAHHEMTHLYHLQVNPEMRRMTAEVYMPPYAQGKTKLYEVVWLEGLAVYWSKVLNPLAPDREVLVSANLAERVRAGWPRIGTELREHLNSSKTEDIDAYMFGGKTGGRFPSRTGYYVGMLIAGRLAKKHSFPELCRLTGPGLQAEVEGALRELEKSALAGE